MSAVERAARDALGFEALRPGQKEVVEAVLAGRDALAVMATGYGKSAIYQIAGVLIDGPTLVVSPLLALQRDQVERLTGEAVGGAAQVSSAVPESEREDALRDARRDRLEFLFMAPEQLAKEDVLEQVRRAAPSLMVVDEAHCISEWGHDFRPDYLALDRVAAAIGRPPILALTATAAPPVREEIVTRLALRDPYVKVTGFDRPNLRLAVERFHDAGAKDRALRKRVAALAPPGIVYTATRKEAERLAEALGAVAYHGGMAGGRRNEVQEAFMSGEAPVVVATTAFGMGIDKPDVRFVVHHAIADSVDAYWQEVGRAGRDGGPAEALLLYRAEDIGLRRFFAGGAEDADRAAFDRSRVEMMRAYAEHAGCRRAFALSYFGEPYEPPCGNCDGCESGTVIAAAGGPFPVGARVEHPKWGEATVQRYEEDKVVVLFDSVGYKALVLDVAGDLLKLSP